MYKEWRGKDLANLSMEEQRKSQMADLVANELYQDAWNRCLLRTRQTEQEIKQLITAITKQLKQ